MRPSISFTLCNTFVRGTRLLLEQTSKPSYFIDIFHFTTFSKCPEFIGGGGGGSSVCSASPFTQVRRRALSEVRGPTFWKFLVAVGNLFSSGLLYRTTKMFPKKEDSLARYTQHCEILCGNFCSIRFCSRTFRNFWLNGRSHFGNSPFLDFLETFPENFQTIAPVLKVFSCCMTRRATYSIRRHPNTASLLSVRFY